jgi:hypothetical protein
MIGAQRFSDVTRERLAEHRHNGEELENAHARIAFDMEGAKAHAPAPRFPDARLPSHPSSRTYSSSIRLSSSFLNSGAGSRSACPADSALGAQVPMAPL